MHGLSTLRFTLREAFLGRFAGAAAALAFALAAPAGATGGGDPEPAVPEAEGCETVVESQFGAYTVEKCFEVWAPDNPGNPSPVSRNFTYLYTVESDPSSFTNVVSFELETPPSPAAVTEAGFLPDSGGVEPDSVDTSTPGVAAFTFLAEGPAGGPCEGIQGICPGAISAPLVVHSPYGPGDVTDNIVALMDDFALEEVATCVGPNTLPNAKPCDAFFWKLRALFHFLPHGHFAGDQFDELTQFAADTSTVFETPEDVVQALFAPLFFFSTNESRAKAQLAALLMNIAVGELFPDSKKCRLFLATPVDTDGDGVADTTVGELLVVVESNILSGDPGLIFQAKLIAVKLNFGVGLIETTSF